MPSGKRKKKACGNLIGHSKDVVCKPYHTIDIGAGDEPALYFSRLQEDNLVLGKKQASYVAVGPMYHYEMRCKKCDVLVGIKYANVMVLEHDWRPRNATYEGRYAIGKGEADVGSAGARRADRVGGAVRAKAGGVLDVLERATWAA